MRICIVLLSIVCIFFLPVAFCAQGIDGSLFKNYTVAFVMVNRSSGEVINADPNLSVVRLSPCSTFKIYNTLIGLELGLLGGADNPWYKWDGVHRPIDAWNHDLTLREAFRVSAVPAFQILARQIGNERMKKYIELIDYGNKDISSGIDTFWLGNSLKISADEQVALLNKLLDGKLPFSQKNIAILKEIMEVEKTEKGTLYGKTGSRTDSQGVGVSGWFVGFLQHGDATYVFACNITGGDNPSGKAARSIVEDILKSKNLL